jgi:hypothetical protein
LVVRVLLEVLKGSCSTVQWWAPFSVNIKEVLMAVPVPVVYATVGSFGVVLLRGGLVDLTPNVLRAL